VSATAPFHVLLAYSEVRDHMALARALAATRQTPVQDQVLAAKRAWGIVAEDLEEQEATALARDLSAAGIESFACPGTALTPLPDTEQVRTRDSLPGEQPTLISVAGITVTSTTKKMVKEGPSAAKKAVGAAIMMTTGLPINIGGKKRKVEKTQTQQDLFFFVDLVYDAPPRRIRIAASEFDYSFLAERKLYQSLGNCKLLVSDLVAAAPRAWQNHGARVLLQGRPINTMGYASLQDLEREERWLVTLRGLDG
jgi:hypothetical protein